jgi:hypothetical protein
LEKWRCIPYDSINLNSYIRSYEYFLNEDKTILFDNATKRPEQKVVKWIFEKSLTTLRYLVYEELNLSNEYKHYLECREYILDYRYDESDIDILLVNDKSPHLSHAFQVKKLTIDLFKDGFSVFKRLNQVEKGITQANEVFKKYKFYKNYLMLVVIINGIDKKDVNQIFRQPSSKELYKHIYSLKNFNELNENIGIFAYEITQPTNLSIDRRGTILSKLLKYPKPIEQPSFLTERTKSHVNWSKKSSIIIY